MYNMDDEWGLVGRLEHYSEVQARFQTSSLKINFEIGGEPFINHFFHIAETLCLQFSKSLFSSLGRLIIY